jgi:hypothetical protein
MMQNSNLRPDGSTAIQCDAGTPIMGRTSTTGTYQILKVNADGSLPVGANTPLTPPSTPSSNSPFSVTLGSGIIGAGTFLFCVPCTIITTPNAGLYRINPFVAFNGIGAGSINIALVEDSSSLASYCFGLNPGVDAFSPGISNLTSGLSCWWHNNTAEAISGQVQIAYNRNNPTNAYLSNTPQFLLAWVHTAITVGALGQFNYGFYEFAKIG